MRLSAHAAYTDETNYERKEHEPDVDQRSRPTDERTVKTTQYSPKKATTDLQ